MAHYDTCTLAKGCFGKVYKDMFKGELAAIKRVPVDTMDKEQLERERRVYYIARHDNIVRLLGDPWVEDGKWNIPLKYIMGENLGTTIFCSQMSKIKLTTVSRATIIKGMCEGLCYLHSKDIVHQDIKPENIMVEHGTKRAVIIDLGLAKFFNNGMTTGPNMGNAAYAAPEILAQHGVRNSSSDVWAMGKVIAELCIRGRLRSFAVTPTNIQEILAAYPYSLAVSKMVDPNPVTRVSMGVALIYIREEEVKINKLRPASLQALHK